jgi:glycosyltransferase involved in cell wall biosynthesis
MACGTPVVAWNNGGPTVTVLDGKTGFLVDPYDTQSFADSLLRLVTTPGLTERLGRAGHRRARQVFSYDRHNEDLADALLRAVESPQLAVEIEEPVPEPVWVKK